MGPLYTNGVIYIKLSIPSIFLGMQSLGKDIPNSGSITVKTYRLIVVNDEKI